MSGLYLEYSYPFESLQSARGYRRNSFHLQTLRFCFFISWRVLPNLSFLTQPDDCAPVVMSLLYLGVSDAYTCACFLTYPIRSIFSLCWAQLFFCVTVFYDYGIQGLFHFFSPVYGALWKVSWERVWVSGWLDGTQVESLTGSPRNSQNAEEIWLLCCAGWEDWALLLHVSMTYLTYCFKIEKSHFGLTSS